MPTTWGWARRYRCWRCCCCSSAKRRRSEAEPAGRPRFAAGELGVGDRAIRARPEDADRASVRESGAAISRHWDPIGLRGVDLAITTYGSLLRAPWIAEVRWRLVVLDEAQAIKNPDAKQTRAVKSLKPRSANGADGHAGGEPAGDFWSCSISSIRVCWDRRRSSPDSPNAWRRARKLPTALCANWCGLTFCGA